MNTRRNPDETRGAILDAAFDEIHEQGFRAASIENILGRTGVTKGALYHHFPNKTALGYAVLDEVIWPWAAERWSPLMDENRNPVDALLAAGLDLVAGDGCEDSHLGCPVNNLVQEMAGLDEGFRKRLNRMLEGWRNTIEAALRRGQEQGLVRTDLDPAAAAAFLVAAYEGSIGLAKSADSPDLLNQCIAGMSSYVESMRRLEQAEFRHQVA